MIQKEVFILYCLIDDCTTIIVLREIKHKLIIIIKYRLNYVTAKF